MNELAKDVRDATLGGVENYCPFGCQTGELDEHGYCRHLVGFTNDCIAIETVQVNPKDGNKFVSSKKEHRAEVQKADTLVNPVTQQLDKGVVHMAKRWVSSRVYRQTIDQDKSKMARAS